MASSRHKSFSQSLDASLAPLLGPLHDVERLVEDLDVGDANRTRGSIRDLRKTLRSALEASAQRRPSLLVQGPPKAGKSTFLVAVARSYVTKVSGLPSLPTLVRIQHGPEWELELFRSDGTRELFRDPQGARVEIQTAHRAWAEGQRNAQTKGDRFEAELDAPRAAARVELRVPAEALAAAPWSLVEVPPYLMGEEDELRTRLDLGSLPVSDVVVLRSEDFARPTYLSRLEPLLDGGRPVFLVVNVDPRRRNLAPDGSAQESLDGSDPVVVVETFQALGASRRWLDAFDGGRLRVHLLPLFQLASDRLTAENRTRRRSRSAIVPRPQRSRAPSEGDALALLERELVEHLRDGPWWREHVREALAEVDGVLEDLRTAFERVAPMDAAPPSLEPGVRALERAIDSLAHVRDEHLSPAE